MTATREAIAGRIIDDLRLQFVGSLIYLRGSLADGRGDLMSDIDIGIRDDHQSDKELAEAVIAYMKQSHRVLFFDWAKSCLPDACVISFFLVDVPMFWSVDFELIVKPQKRLISLRDVVNTHPDHLLKLWVGTAKHYVRKKDGSSVELDRLYERVTGKPATEFKAALKLRECLETIIQSAPMAYPEFLEECLQFQQRIDRA